MKRGACAFAITLLAAVGCEHAPEQASTPAAPPAISKVASSVALPNWDSDAPNLQRLDAFAPELASKRIVMLGESDHYVHEKYAYELLFVSWLFQRGFRDVAFEMGRAQAKRFDRYVETGDETFLSVTAEDRAAMPKIEGTLASNADDPCGKADSQERLRFFRALRDLSERRPASTSRLHVLGFDVDFFPSMGFRDIDSALENPSAALIPLRDLAAQAKRETGSASAEALHNALKFVADHRSDVSAVIGAAQTFELESDLGAQAASLQFQEVAFQKPSLDALRAAYTTREQNMFWLMDRHLAKALPQGTIMIGHTMHLSAHSPTVAFGREGDARPMWPSIGSYVKEHWPRETESVWFMYADGSHRTLKGCAAVENHPEAVEQELATHGDRFVMTMRAATESFPDLARPHAFLQNGDPGFGVVADQADFHRVREDRLAITARCARPNAASVSAPITRLRSTMPRLAKRDRSST